MRQLCVSAVCKHRVIALRGIVLICKAGTGYADEGRYAAMDREDSVLFLIGFN
jgi:hypothetical protein